MPHFPRVHRLLRLCLAVLTLSFSLGSASAAFATQPGDRPNILFILTDDLGYGDLGAYGHWTIKTPNIDRLAKEGVRLTSFYAPSPLCSPSRASFLTGRMPYRTGIKSWIPEGQDVQLGVNEITLASLLNSEGYDTAVIGKWHLNAGLDVPGHRQPKDYGFDHSFVLHAYTLPHHRNPTNFFRNGEPLGEIEGFAAGITVDETINWLSKRRSAGRPFFLYLPFAEPHGTLASPDRFLEQYARYTSGEPVPFPNGLLQPPQGLEARGPGEYYANISYLDSEIGRLLTHLEAEGLYQNTIVVFASDNGPVTTDWRQWWETNLYGQTGGYRGRKGDLYEGGIRVPGIIRYPGVIEPGRVSDVLFHGYDLMPTLLSVVGIPIPEDRPIDGINVMPQLLDKANDPVRSVYWALPRPEGANYAVRRGKWKLLADYSQQPIALYDLEIDRFEHVNRLATETEVAATLSDDLQAFFASVESVDLEGK